MSRKCANFAFHHETALTLPATAVDSDSANQMMDSIREKFVSGDLTAVAQDDSGIKLVAAEEFA